MPVIKLILLIHQTLELRLIHVVVTSTKGLMMIKHRIISDHIVVTLFNKLETKVYIIICNCKILLESSDFIKLRSLY